MNSNFLFYREFQTKASYDSVIRLFKSGIEHTFFKGYISADHARVYYTSRFLTPRGVLVTPAMQVDVSNAPNENGELLITFKPPGQIYVLNLVALTFIAVVIYLTDFKNLVSDYGPWVLLVLVPLAYGVGLLSFSIEVYYFQKMIREVMVD